MGEFEVVYLKEGTCEICCCKISHIGGDPVVFVKTPAGLVCDDCVEAMSVVLDALIA